MITQQQYDELKEERDAFLAELQKANATIIDLQRNPPKLTQQHLAEIRAEAVLKFAEDIGVFSSEYDDQGYVEVAKWRVKEYVEEVRQGGAE
jgi:aminoglycoside N3'-acetyltransferase